MVRHRQRRYLSRRRVASRHRLRAIPQCAYSAQHFDYGSGYLADPLGLSQTDVRMRWTRRKLFGMGAAAGLAGCINPRPEARLLPSRTELPKPFEARLPIPAVLQPVSTDASTDYYDV